MENNKNDISSILDNSREQFNVLLGNMFQFDDADMQMYDACYRNVFGQGVNFSYMSTTFFAQFATEILNLMQLEPLQLKTSMYILRMARL